MSEIVHWEQMEEFTTVTALRLMARDTLANFAWDHWMKCKQVERQNQTIADLRNADAQEPQRRNGVLQGTVQHLKGQLADRDEDVRKLKMRIVQLEEDKERLQRRNERINGEPIAWIDAKRGVEE